VNASSGGEPPGSPPDTHPSLAGARRSGYVASRRAKPGFGRARARSFSCKIGKPRPPEAGFAGRKAKHSVRWQNAGKGGSRRETSVSLRVSDPPAFEAFWA